LLQALKEQISKESGRAEYFVCDVSNPIQVTETIRKIIETFGKIDVLVNNAAIFSTITMRPFEEIPIDEWVRVLNVNITGTFLMTQTVGRWLLAQGRPGSVVNLSSMAGFQPYGASGAYSTVKSAVIMLGEHFSIEWARKNILQQSDDMIEEQDKLIEEEQDDPRWNPPPMDENGNPLPDQGQVDDQQQGDNAAPEEDDQNKKIREAELTVKQMKEKGAANRSMQDEAKYRSAIQILSRNK
jgi:hypothetical protein